MNLNPALLALIGTVFGGAGLKAIEVLLNRSKGKADIATEIRTELRQDVQSLRDEVRAQGLEIEKWKAKYYDLLDQFYKKGIVPEVSEDYPEEPDS